MFFAVAALFNIAVGAAMVIVPSRIAMHLNVDGLGAPYVVATVGLLIVAFGIGYGMVAQDPAHNRGVIWIGMIGKLGVAGLGALQFAAAIIPFRYLALGMTDVVFAGLFALFLWRTRRR
jgi:hypothetical protein